MSFGLVWFGFNVAFGYMSFGLMSFDLLSFSLMSFGILSVYPIIEFVVHFDVARHGRFAN